MSILFAISILAFSALLWASLSIARHIRVSSRLASPSADTLGPLRDRHFHREPLADLNDPPLSRRTHQNPTRASRTQDGRNP